MSKLMSWMIVICAIFFMDAEAALFTDDFDRADVGPTTDGSLIGANYVNSLPGTAALKDWQISGNKVVFPEPAYVAGGNVVLHNTSVQTLTSAEGASFSIQADITIDTSSRWAGVAFNYQDKDNFYAFRVDQSAAGKLQYQLLEVVNGGAGTATHLSVTDNDDFVLDHTYNLTVAYDQSTDNYTFLVKDGATIMATADVLGSALVSGFSDGYGGLYASGINMNPTYDNLSISSIPEPATLNLVLLSALALFGVRRLQHS